MSRKKKTKSEEVLPTVVEPESVPPADEQPSSADFDKANLDYQKNRHDQVNKMFGLAAKVVCEYLQDESIDVSAKMFPAKLAMDIYSTQEKFKREDERIEIEKRKLTLEEVKANKPNLIFNQQNNYLPQPGGQPTPEQPQNPPRQIDLVALKKKQEKMLASFVTPPPAEDGEPK